MAEALAAINNIGRKELIERLAASEFSFALWRLPKDREEILIVSIRPPRRTDTHISTLDPGFMINKFQDNHPGKPFFIPADLIFRNDAVTIDPRINAKDLDYFQSELKKKKRAQKNIGGALSVPTAFHDPFRNSAAKAIRKIREQQLDKVVLSRCKDIPLSESFPADRFFRSMATAHPEAFCSIVFVPGEGLWAGASPELLLFRDETLFKTQAVAGTKALAAGQPVAEVTWGQKEIEEQAMVSRYIVNCFKKIRLREFKETGPQTIKTGKLAHLRTTYEVDHCMLRYEDLADHMLELLHPTSAVCGMPMERAQDFINTHEPHDRSFFSGFLGPVNFNGSTNLFVNLRCMKISRQKARLYAGAGITSGSDPDKEWQETELKMNTLTDLF